jgi:DNA primase
MGTALTERQLKELARLTKRLYLCFDADAAGQDATLRGMELAAAQGFDIRVVSLPPGTDPADDPSGFEERLRRSEHYFLHRVRVEHARRERTQAFEAVRAFLAPLPDSPERQDAEKLAADLFGLTRETAAGLAPRGRRHGTGTVSPRLLDAGARLERNALAAVAVHESLVRLLAGLSAEHFDRDENRRMRAHLIGDVQADEELMRYLAELHARAADESLDEPTGEQLLLRLRERKLRRDLAAADDEHLLDLQQALAKVRTAIREFA